MNHATPIISILQQRTMAMGEHHLPPSLTMGDVASVSRGRVIIIVACIISSHKDAKQLESVAKPLHFVALYTSNLL